MLTAWYLEEIPPGFKDDGMSWFPDSVFGFDLRRYARIHDWFYCSRAGYKADGATGGAAERGYADRVIRELIHADAPLGLRWVASLVYRGVRAFGEGSYDTCGPQPKGASTAQELLAECRHGMPMPTWMRYGRTVGGVFYDRDWDKPAGNYNAFPIKGPEHWRRLTSKGTQKNAGDSEPGYAGRKVFSDKTDAHDDKFGKAFNDNLKATIAQIDAYNADLLARALWEDAAPREPHPVELDEGSTTLDDDLDREVFAGPVEFGPSLEEFEIDEWNGLAPDEYSNRGDDNAE
jgi:hypothetical protein